MIEITILNKKYEIDEGITIVGRGKESDIVVDSPRLSRMHARLVVDGETIAVEDLGSKNGTFVNNMRIEKKHALVMGDQVRLADLDCEMRYPEPRVEKKSVKKLPDQRMRFPGRSGKGIVKKIVAVAAAVAAVMAAYSYIKGYESAEFRAARTLVQDAERIIKQMSVSDSVEDNAALGSRLSALRAELLAVPKNSGEQYDKAKKLADAAQDFIARILVKNKTLGVAAAARESLERILQGIAHSSMTLREAIRALEVVRTSFEGTEVSARAQAKISELKELMLGQERGFVDSSMAQAGLLAESGEFGKAVAVLDACLNMEFSELDRTELECVERFKADSIARAEAYFQKIISSAVDDAQTGDCDEQIQSLQDTRERGAFLDLGLSIDAAVQRIMAIKDARIEKARAEIAAQLNEVSALEFQRQYGQAVMLCDKLAESITEKGLLAEIALRKQADTLLSAAKQAVIAYINGHGGGDVYGVGTVTRMTDDAVEFVVDERVMAVPWNRISDGEFAGLVGKTLSPDSPAELYVAHALLLARLGNAAEAAMCIDKARKQSQRVADAYGGLFLAFFKDEPQEQAVTQKEKEPTRKFVRPPIALSVEEPCGASRISWPVSSGVCFPKGALLSVRELRLTSSSGQEVPCQFKALATWPDKSVRWVLLDFQTSVVANARQRFALHWGPGVTHSAYETGLKSSQSGDSISVMTGMISVAVGGRGGFVNQVAIQWGKLLGHSSFEGPFFKEGGVTYTCGLSLPQSMVIEDVGPVRATVRMKGKHKSADGKQSLDYTIRLDFYAGLPWFKASYTVESFEDAVSLEGMWIQLPLAMRDAPANAMFEGPLKLELGRGASVRLEQPGSAEYVIKSGEQQLGSGKRALGWISLENGMAGVMVAVRNFWQLFPKRLEATGDGLLKLWLVPGAFTWDTGFGKTHEMLYCFYGGTQSPASMRALALAFEKPLVATMDPAWVCGIEAFQKIAPAPSRSFPRYEQIVDLGLRTIYEQRESRGQYGMANFGDWQFESGTGQADHWGNLEYDGTHAFLMAYARTGDIKYFHCADEMVRHMMDVDIVRHHSSPRFNGLPFMHGPNHRWEPEEGHIWAEGLVEYYWLTGDVRALETACGIADAIARSLAGTAHATSYERATGWMTIACIAAYEATWDKKYLNTAKTMIDAVIRLQDPERGCWYMERVEYKGKMMPDSCVWMTTGILCEGIYRYWKHDPRPDVRNSLCKAVDFFIEWAWDSKNGTAVDRIVWDPITHEKVGITGAGKPMLGCLAGLARAYEVSQDRKYIDIGRQVMESGLSEYWPSCGKQITQQTRNTPYFLCWLDHGK